MAVGFWGFCSLSIRKGHSRYSLLLCTVPEGAYAHSRLYRPARTILRDSRADMKWSLMVLDHELKLYQERKRYEEVDSKGRPSKGRSDLCAHQISKKGNTECA